MKYIAFTLVCACVLGTGATMAIAQEIADPLPEIVSSEIITTPSQDLVLELAELKIKEDQASGVITKFLIRLKIRQIENQLNIKKALN